MIVGVGLSGGVDSAVSAALLQRGGHEVRGFTMLLTEDGGATVEKAEAVSKRLGISHAVLDFRQPFAKWICGYFCDSYARGRTPSPCVRCNRLVKFGLLLEAVLEAGCDCLATGHYARLARVGDGPALLRGTDPRKDQSYFLSQVQRERLERVLFPLGGMLKAEVKEMGDSLGVVPRAQGESQDLCFLPDGDFASYLSEHRPELRREGQIVDGAGKVLGRHTGAYQYTVGQRRGLGLGGGPWFVRSVDMRRNQVRVSHGEDLNCRHVWLQGMNWLAEPPLAGQSLDVLVQMRYLMKPRPAQLLNTGAGLAELMFPDGAPLVPAGQVATCYQEDRVVAGGWIHKVE